MAQVHTQASRQHNTVEPVWATTLSFHEKVVAVDRWSPLAVKIYSKNDVGAAKKVVAKLLKIKEKMSQKYTTIINY